MDNSTFEGNLHTSKRMHFIEELQRNRPHVWDRSCIRQNVCTSLRIDELVAHGLEKVTCIRQNVCTSLRIRPACRIRQRPLHLHTSKRMHFIEECSS